ncbi:copper chaperone, partial [Pseudoalteromonas sp. S558]
GHESVIYQPGRYHLMVLEPQEPLKVGQERKLTLYYRDGNRHFTNAQVDSLDSQSKQSKSTTPPSHN